MASIKALDDRRNYIILEDAEAVLFAANQFIEIAKKAILDRGQFVVALSGGSTPRAIFQELLHYKKDIDWSLVKIFWSDERAVPPTSSESNYKMAMDTAFGELVLPENVFRMPAEKDLETESLQYESFIQETCLAFDLVMLGMGDDGHTASLFPYSKALDIEGRLVVPNWVESKKTWRMTLTYEGIHRSRAIIFYVFGKNKAEEIATVLKGPPHFHEYPSQAVGTKKNPALWLLDKSAASCL
ncbi:MAG: 6-phosphogluconolactonase [Chlamydiota bacterium]